MKSKTFRIQSGGAAYNLDVGFVSDRVQVKNLTKWATDDAQVKHYWNRYMTDAYAYSEVTTDDAMVRAINTSNGFTPYDTGAVTDNQADITGATQANPCVVSATAHGFGAAGTVFTLRPRDIVGMTELNDNLYHATIIDANSFSLQTMTWDNVDSTGFGAWSSAGVAYALSKTVEDEGFKGITLGTAVVGANDDILEVTCFLDDQYINLGDIV